MKTLLRLPLAAAFLLLPAIASAITVTDLAGRKVEIKAPVKHILLGEGRFLNALALIEEGDPSAHVAGMLGEFSQLDPAGFAQYTAAFPRIKDLPAFGQATVDTVSVEKMIALQPDAAILGLEGHGPATSSKEMLDQLSAAGIPIVFIDFRKEPILNTPKSIELLGELLDRKPQAAAYVSFYNSELEKISSKLVSAKKRPTVFIENRVGMNEGCCDTMANGLMGRFIDFAGGKNIAADLIPGAFGTLNLELVLAAEPDVYIGTAIGSPATSKQAPNRIVLGADATGAEAKTSLAHAVSRPGVDQISAIKSKRVHAIWHHFYNSPTNIVAIQAFAKWLHPELFGDLDPQATFDTLRKDHPNLRMAGTYWISLQ